MFRNWSLMRYDLKTALDVLDLPCHVQITDDTLFNKQTTVYDNRHESTKGSVIANLEKKICTCYVRARVLPIQDIDWYIYKKGRACYKDHERFVNSEILIPLECTTKVTLQDGNAGKQYHTIREVAEDFPRFVQVDQDTVCVSPGNTECQIVKKGSVLELDRITKAAQAIRGYRENYLICKDTEHSRELAFKLMSTVRFSKLVDTTRYIIKDLIERIPLPQTVDFLNTNPYDIISASDQDAMDLMLMLTGPIELISLQMREFIVGTIEDTNNIIGIPNDDEFLENTLVKILVINSNQERCSDVSDKTICDNADFETVMDKMYLLYSGFQTVVIVRGECTSTLPYDDTDNPATPPLPPKIDTGLKHTLSVPSVSQTAESACKRNNSDLRSQRKRIVSTGDLERKTGSQRRRQESRRFKAYLTQFSRRMKTTASHFLFGIDTAHFSQELPSGLVTSLDKTLSRSNPDVSAIIEPNESSDGNGCMTGFICYIDIDATNSKHLANDLHQDSRETLNGQNGLSTTDCDYATSNAVKQRDKADIATSATANHCHSNNNDDTSGTTLYHNSRTAANSKTRPCVSYAEVAKRNKNSFDRVKDKHSVEYAQLVVNEIQICNSEQKTEVIYASVDKTKKKPKETRPISFCAICRDVFINSEFPNIVHGITNVEF